MSDEERRGQDPLVRPARSRSRTRRKPTEKPEAETGGSSQNAPASGLAAPAAEVAQAVAAPAAEAAPAPKPRARRPRSKPKPPASASIDGEEARTDKTPQDREPVSPKAASESSTDSSGSGAEVETPRGNAGGETAGADAPLSRPRTRSRSRRRPAARPSPTADAPAEAPAGAPESDKGEVRPPIGSDTAAAEGPDSSDTEDRSKKTPARKRRTGRKPRQSEQRRSTGPTTMLITIGSERNQIAILSERELIEHYVAHADDRSIVGNIYLGRVQNVLPGMEAAFLDINETRNAVLYAGEVAFDEEVEGATPRIETILKSGQAVLAQVTKDPMGSKGARLTTEISVAGRYLVLVPDADFLGISRRLDDDERRRLRDITSRIRPASHGLIVRTAALGVDEDDLSRDVQRLVRIWDAASAKAKRAKPPKLIHAEPELVMRVIRDLFTADVEKVIVDDQRVYEEMTEYVGELMPELLDRIELYKGDLPLFENHHVVEQIRKAIDRKVWLKSGGHIVIDRTEAMTVVDVNTGRFVGRSNLEETVFQTNLEAAEEVAKQLRLRDIGGIIVIDFIDMLYERNRDELLRTFKSALSKDKTRTQVFGISELGLVQMTRKRISEGLLEAFSEKCDKCEGRGIVLTDLQ